MRYHSRPLAVSIALAVAAGAAVADEQVASAAPGGGAGSPDRLADWDVPSISWRVSREGVAPGPEVVINDMVVIRPLADAGGIPSQERARIIAARISSLIHSDLKAGRVPGNGICAVFRGEWIVAGGPDGRPILATAETRTAQMHSLSAKDLAETWANNIRLALGLPIYGRRRQELSSRGRGRAAPPETALPGATGDFRDRQAWPSDGGPIAAWWGLASWYGPGFHGRRTANGEIYNQYALTAAHRTLPFGTLLRVSFPATGKATVVRINDRGPWIKGRSLDLSLGAARVLGMVNHGVAKVRVEVLRLGT